GDDARTSEWPPYHSRNERPGQRGRLAAYVYAYDCGSVGRTPHCNPLCGTGSDNMRTTTACDAFLPGGKARRPATGRTPGRRSGIGAHTMLTGACGTFAIVPICRGSMDLRTQL